ncbi:MAG TPA: type II toxin-antitoxin system VapC family toxin [Bacteroidota bacterium]|nr:type II toxin-antitoxin system VapC family toxin [Bacteroidota bacterium]
MKYMLDTDICSYIIRKRPQHIIEKFKKIPLGDIGISVITVCEFESGIPGSAHPEKLRSTIDTFLAPFGIIDFQQADARAFGIIDSYLRQKGIPIGDMDTLIASQALSRGLILVTKNMKHYSRIPHLLFESWK